MLLLDGCFILVILNGIHGVRQITESEPGSGYEACHHNSNNFMRESAELKQETVLQIEHRMLDVSQKSSENDDTTRCCKNSDVLWYGAFAVLDLFLLENQIPFLVVRKIHEVLVSSGMGNMLAENIIKYVEENLQYLTKAFGTCDRPTDFCHLLHLCHMQFRPSVVTSHMKPLFGGNFVDIVCKLSITGVRKEQDESNTSDDKQFNSLEGGLLCRWHRATQYHEAGVTFKRKEFLGHRFSMLDVIFKDGVLEIPCLTVDDRTSSLFRNMMAFEQTCPQVGNCVTAYVIFMSQLISRSDDVTLLSQRGIIVHQLHSDKAVSSLFTRFTKGVVFDFMGNFYLKSTCRRMEMYYQSRLNRWIAWLRHNHLSNPWLGLALLAGLLVLFCTIAQTVLIVLAYVGPT